MGSSSLFLMPPGVPVESKSRVTLRLQAALRSSRRTMQRAGGRLERLNGYAGVIMLYDGVREDHARHGEAGLLRT